MNTTRTPIRRGGRKGRITPEAVAAYRLARAIDDLPPPDDPEEKERQTRAFYAATEDLRRALRQEVWELEVFDTLGDPPSRDGEEKIPEWHRVRDIRRELERLGG
jgi:hypothetical protein